MKTKVLTLIATSLFALSALALTGAKDAKTASCCGQSCPHPCCPGSCPHK